MRPALIVIDLALAGEAWNLLKHCSQRRSQILLLAPQRALNVEEEHKVLESGARGYLCRPLQEDVVAHEISNILRLSLR